MDVGLVCDSCSAFNPMGAQRCLRCGDGLSLLTPGDVAPAPRASTSRPGTARPSAPRGAARTTDPAPSYSPTVREPITQRQPLRGDDQRSCPTCGTPVPSAHRFCFNCGARMPDPDRVDDGFAEPEETRVKARPTGSAKQARSTMFFGAIQAARAKLTLIRGDGLDGVSFTLAGEEHYAGRIDCPLLFPDDPFLSPVHANFFYREGMLVVRDESSTNGVYVRITGTTEIELGTWFLVGEQVLELQNALDDVDEPVDDGTYFFASPRRPSNLRVIQVLRGGDTGLAYRAASDTVSIGREGNDINFPDDPFISGHHARVSWSGTRLTLADLGSRNGTFVRISGEQVLRHGDYVFMGQQLLRVEIV
jgi:pSer/pThr/pTyr-binding forkhead associated (FHA) protein/ribosomal protein L40E